MTGFMTFLAGLFSSSKVQDLAIDGLKQISGLNEMTAKEKSEYILQYMSATKHQSPIRRLIAFTMVGLYLLMALTWLIAAAVGYYFDHTISLEFAGAVKMLLVDSVMQPFNLILSFYFATQIASKFGS